MNQPFKRTKDNCLWNTCRYIRRIQKVLSENTSASDIEYIGYKHGTHFLFP